MKLSRKQLRNLLIESLNNIWSKRIKSEPNAWTSELRQIKNLIFNREYDIASDYLIDYPEMLFQISKDASNSGVRNENLTYYLTRWLPLSPYHQLNDAALKGNPGLRLSQTLAADIKEKHRNRPDLNISGNIARIKRKR